MSIYTAIGNYIEVKKFIYMLEIDISKKFLI